MSTISPKRRKIGGRILVCLRCCKCDLNAPLLQESMNRKLCEYHAIDGNWFGFIVSLILPISFRITMCVCVCLGWCACMAYVEYLMCMLCTAVSLRRAIHLRS